MGSSSFKRSACGSTRCNGRPLTRMEPWPKEKRSVNVQWEVQCLRAATLLADSDGCGGFLSTKGLYPLFLYFRHARRIIYEESSVWNKTKQRSRWTMSNRTPSRSRRRKIRNKQTGFLRQMNHWRTQIGWSNSSYISTHPSYWFLFRKITYDIYLRNLGEACRRIYRRKRVQRHGKGTRRV